MSVYTNYKEFSGRILMATEDGLDAGNLSFDILAAAAASAIEDMGVDFVSGEYSKYQGLDGFRAFREEYPQEFMRDLGYWVHYLDRSLEGLRALFVDMPMDTEVVVKDHADLLEELRALL